MPLSDEHKSQAFVARLKRELPHCNCLMSGVCPDRGAAICVMPKHGGGTLTLQLDVSQLGDAGYLERMLKVILDQVRRS
ncbi:hypothetical protein NS337_14085 [Pseudomonas oryzihabitans]|nr:hypothetical protein NS337_14085 [Pseudomonas psychrotolerans]